MNVKEQHVVTGMSKDSAVSQHNPNLVYDARNIRITVQGTNSSLLSVTNEKGTKEIKLGTELLGTPIGSCVINDSLVLFTHNNINREEGVFYAPDHIYRIVVLDDTYTVSTLFAGDANFSLSNPIETTPVYETESIQKVYWVDGINQPRVINIVNTVGATNANIFNFNREINMSHSLTVEKINSGGVFPPGTIQYALSYFNKFAQETNIFEITPLYYLSPKDKGLAADKMASCSFKLQLSGVDINFEYVRLYSIVRAAANATPQCRVVGDYAINVTPDDTKNPIQVINDAYNESSSFNNFNRNNVYVGKIEADVQDPSVLCITDIVPIYQAANSSEWPVSVAYDYHGNPDDVSNATMIFTLNNSNYVIFSYQYTYSVEGSSYKYYYYFRPNSEGLLKIAWPRQAVVTGGYIRIGEFFNSYELGYFRKGVDAKAVNLTIVDNGIIGRTINASTLLFIGGEELLAGTLSQKDNTLFLGNIEINRRSIGNLPCNFTVGNKQYTYTINDVVNQNIESRKAIVSSNTKFQLLDSLLGKISTKEVGYNSLTLKNIGPTGSDFYNYTADNNRSSRYIKRFKTGESYRLGFIAQYKTGKWSEAIWIDDVKNTIVQKDLATSNSKKYITGAWEFKLSDDVAEALLNAGYVRIAPVVVYPELVDRLVYAQGLLSPTVYNAADRIDGSPYAQSSWFFRLFNGEPDVTIARNTLVDSNYEFTYDKATWSRYGCYASAHNASLFPNNYARSEIQCNEGPRLYVPNAYKKKDDSTYSLLKDVNFLEYFNNYYFVDSNILTLNSPDIDSSEELLQSDFTGLNVRIVGFSTALSQATDLILTSENTGINVNDSQTIHFTIEDRVPSLAYYSDSAVDNSNEDGVSAVNTDATYGWVTYPWHRNGSLNNQQPLTSRRKQNGFTSRTAMLKNKIEATLWYGTTNYADYTKYVNLESTSPQLYNNDQLSALRLNRSDKTTVIYYGNIDKVLTATTPAKNSDESDPTVYISNYINRTWESNKQYSLDITEGYWIRRHWVKGKPARFTYNANTNSSDTYMSMLYTKGYPCYTLLATLGYIAVVDVDTPFEGRLSGESPRSTAKDPVPIKYKSTPHLVFSLNEGSAEQYALPTFKENNTYKASYIDNITDSKRKRFWDSNTPTVKSAISDLSVFIPDTDTNKQGLFIAEVYREESTDFIKHRFGGISQEAFISNKWIRCGEAVAIGTDTKITYLEGDTYFQRYDCLKTYPFTLEDSNSVIEMYSTTLETRVNLDFAYNSNRGMRNNTTVLPANFNLFNHLSYEQENNFFTYHSLDYARYDNNKFPSTITWSLEKKLGEDIDTWASIDGVNVLDMDGSLGEVTKLFKYNDDIYCLQEIGFSQLLFNSRVQIPTSDGVPIEISNGMKMQGSRYLGDKIGCVNKWSFVASPLGVYWIDDTNRVTYMFNGQLHNLSAEKGMQTWMNTRCTMKPWNQSEYNNCWGFYSNITKDIIWVYRDIALAYSEVLNQYTSFIDYGGMLVATHINGHIIGYTKEDVDETIDQVDATITHAWELGTGNYNEFFGEFKPHWLTFISNSQITDNKIYNNLEWRSHMKDGEEDKPYNTFDHIQVWTEHQDTESVAFTNQLYTEGTGQPISYNAAGSNLRKKFNVWRCQIPRDKLSTNKRARISNPWCYIKLSSEDTNYYKHEFTDLVVDYFV